MARQPEVTPSIALASSPRPDHDGTVKIVSWNLLHRGGVTLDDIVTLIVREKPDMVLMQEATARIDNLAARIGGTYVRNPLPGRLHGLAVWTSMPLRHPSVTLTLQPGIAVHRLCQIIDVGDFVIANVHLSHGQLLNRRQLRKIARVLPARAAILGDCNMIGAALLPGFRDVGPRQATFDIGGFVPVRLDRCLVRGLTCRATKTLGRAGSDHRAIAVRLSLPGQGA
ncbi:endonuclease/exonuclease/phosphatase family protein [Telmatospirillum sp.]|uniref:endonuclease/exonuclease/phosphatase family protein n=1 Tax=Telmatospirillum sp. TaxID=2079197 RepID=UPI00284318D8|nr:endonuclease/exonuclease/phosphatase family protein [Telmatospirillum sp.]MDR3436293.1 endonuclease/exonuclease/phosphatase family protein [Telmatospirillum sp.]